MSKEISQVLDLVESALSNVAKAQVLLNPDQEPIKPNSGPITLGVNELINRLQMDLGVARNGLASSRDLIYSINCHQK